MKFFLMLESGEIAECHIEQPRPDFAHFTLGFTEKPPKAIVDRFEVMGEKIMEAIFGDAATNVGRGQGATEAEAAAQFEFNRTDKEPRKI